MVFSDSLGDLQNMLMNYRRRKLRELDAQVENASRRVQTLKDEYDSAEYDCMKELLADDIKAAENELKSAENARSSWQNNINVNITMSAPDSPVFEEDVTPPIPDTKDGAFSFTVNLLHWIVYIAFKVSWYAVTLWIVWVLFHA